MQTPQCHTCTSSEIGPTTGVRLALQGGHQQDVLQQEFNVFKKSKALRNSSCRRGHGRVGNGEGKGGEMEGGNGGSSLEGEVGREVGGSLDTSLQC